MPPSDEELTGWDDPEARVRRAIQSDGFDLYAQDIVALAEGAAPARLRRIFRGGDGTRRGLRSTIAALL